MSCKIEFNIDSHMFSPFVIELWLAQVIEVHLNHQLISYMQHFESH